MPELRIIDFEPRFARDFRDLNLAWISALWEPTDDDLEVLEQPQAQVIDLGGSILLAELDGRIIGSCALLKTGNTEYELAKMAIAEPARGRGVGENLARAAVHRARQLGATRVHLESHSDWTPAIRLYEKLGFEHSANGCSSRERCNVQMQLFLNRQPGDDT